VTRAYENRTLTNSQCEEFLVHKRKTALDCKPNERHENVRTEREETSRQRSIKTNGQRTYRRESLVRFVRNPLARDGENRCVRLELV